MPEPKTKRAAIYTRVSTRSQAEKHGTAYQKQALLRMADARGWTVTGIYSDEGYSGRTDERPALKEMTLAVQRGEVDVVLVWRWDRLFRSLVHLVQMLQDFEDRNVDLVSHQEGTDTTTSLGRALFQVAGTMAELESALARERIQAGIEAARARGTRLGRPRAKLSADEAVEAVAEHGSIRRAAEALGASPSLIARRLREAQPSAAAAS